MPASSSPSYSLSLASPPRLVPNTDHPDSSHHSINISIPSSPSAPPPPPRNTPTLDSILQHHLMMLPPHLRTFPTTQNSSIHSQSQSPIHQSPLHYIRVPAPPNSSPSIPSHHPSVPTVPIQYHPSSHMSSYPNFHIPQHPQMSVSQSSINHMLTPPPHPPLSLPHPLLSYIDRSLSIITNDQYRHNAMICSLIRNIRAYMESSSHPHSSTLHTQPPSHQLEESVKDHLQPRTQSRKRNRPSEDSIREQGDSQSIRIVLNFFQEMAFHS